MNKSEENDILNKWLKGELTDQEFESQFPEKDIQVYKSVINEFDSWEVDDTGIELQEFELLMQHLTANADNFQKQKRTRHTYLHEQENPGYCCQRHDATGFLDVLAIFCENIDRI